MPRLNQQLLAVLLGLHLAVPSLQARADVVPKLAVAEAPPTTEEVLMNTRPLIRARMRLPDSLQGLTVTRIEAAVDDPARFAVEVQFQGRTPFGLLTTHQARFHMKRSVNRSLWVVTAD